MTLSEHYDKQIPEYYPAMYLDGYTPAQIFYAAKRGLYQQHMEHKQMKTATADVRTALTAALQNVFNG